MARSNSNENYSGERQNQHEVSAFESTQVQNVTTRASQADFNSCSQKNKHYRTKMLTYGDHK